MTHIIPAIDLLGGKCVRLHKGDFGAQTTYGDDPVAQAKVFEAGGAEWLHVVDLDGARDAEQAHGSVVAQIARESDMRVQTGGGIRTREQVAALLEAGVDRVVVGSLAVTQPDTVKGWIEEMGREPFVAALDVNIENAVPRPALKGWTEASEVTLWEVIEDYGDALQTVLITDISRDGVLGGANVELYREVMERYPHLDVITSGGVGTLDDVRELKALEPYGIIVGKALYENRFTVAEAVAC